MCAAHGCMWCGCIDAMQVWCCEIVAAGGSSERSQTGRAAWRRNGHHLMTDDDIELCKHLAKGVIDESLA